MGCGQTACVLIFPDVDDKIYDHGSADLQDIGLFGFVGIWMTSTLSLVKSFPTIKTESIYII